MTEEQQLEDFLAHKYHASFTKSEDSVFSIDYYCIYGTQHTLYSPCIAGLTAPEHCGCGPKPADNPEPQP